MATPHAGNGGSVTPATARDMPAIQNTPPEEWVILWVQKSEEGRLTSNIGAVSAHDSTQHLGTHASFEIALDHAKALAMSHPGIQYVVAQVAMTVLQTAEQAVAVNAELKRLPTPARGYKAAADWYKAAGVNPPKAKRLTAPW